MPNLFYYVSTVALLFSMSMDVKAGMIEDLQSKGDIKAVVECTVRRESLTCIVVAYEGSLYSVAGFEKEGDFLARYIAKQVEGRWVVVWVYGTEV